MKTIKIRFADFWSGFNPETNFITQTLRKKYNVIISDEAEYVFLSSFGTDFLTLNEKSIKIFFSGENMCPDFNLFDYAIAFDHIEFNNRYLRLPLYCVYDAFNHLSNEREIDAEEVLNRKFCSFVYSNSAHSHPARKDFFQSLSNYKQIDSGGSMLNNIGHYVPDKLDFIKNYKFNIAFENSAVHGYTTEKIVEAMAVNTVPIYWGNPSIHLDFNAHSFVNANDFSSWEELAKYIIYLDQDDTAYLEILNQPIFSTTHYIKWQEILLNFLSHIIDRPFDEAKILQPYGFTHNYRRRFQNKLPNTDALPKRILRKLLRK